MRPAPTATGPARRWPAAAVLLLLCLCLCVPAPVAAAGELDVLRAQGARVYERYCAGCHGAAGDGRGPAAALLLVKPRDFTSGVFKFRSTPSGQLPTDEDLYRVITRGVARSSMPGWALLPERERVALVQYVKTFSPEWQQRGPGAPIFIPEPPASLGSPASVERGRELYGMLGCGECHGAGGRGDGPSAATLERDVWGNPQKPVNFTRGRLKSGPGVKDIYRTFMTGLNGTAMPSYGDILSEPDGEHIREGDAWHLISYVLALRPPPGGRREAPVETAARR
jgi:cytochrome c oxidase cbb3-type subunit 2